MEKRDKEWKREAKRSGRERETRKEEAGGRKMEGESS